MNTVLLGIHIGAGTVGILLGPAVMWQETKRLAAGQLASSAVGAAYNATVMVICVSASPLPSWSHACVHGIGGSYIALVTALVVVALTVDGPVKGSAEVIPWVLPAAVGTPLIEIWRRHLLRSVARTGRAAPGIGSMSSAKTRLGPASDKR